MCYARPCLGMNENSDLRSASEGCLQQAMLSFIQSNLHKSDLATTLLGQQLSGQSQVITLITEPHTTAGRITGMPRGTTVVSDRTIQPGQPGPRAGIVASRDTNIHSLDRWCSRDCAAAMAKLHGKQTVIASIYLDINKPAVPQWLEDLLLMASNKKYPIILGVDSNAHSSLYGPDNNARGDAFEDFIMQHCLEVHNSGNAPTFETMRGPRHIQTHIDVTLSRDLHFNLDGWRVDRSYNASDHNTIHFQAPPQPPGQHQDKTLVQGQLAPLL